MINRNAFSLHNKIELNISYIVYFFSYVSQHGTTPKCIINLKGEEKKKVNPKSY